MNLIKKTGQFEKSCGAVVYKYQGQDILVLIEKMQKGHYSLPKGHSEGAESEVETALREIKEETNLEVILDTDFRKVIYFSPSPNCLKEVVFFVGEALNDDLIKQEEEIEELFWVEFDSAVDLLTYENDQKVVLAAQKHLRNITKKEE
ncbi:MAG: NUDIX domain-containing protein [Bacilli bacterium]|nr:NUDIX domain-containing protein [Bacilli bacterium]